MAQEGALPRPERWRPSPPILSGLGQFLPGGGTLQETGGPGWQSSQQNLLWKHTAGRLGPAAALSGAGGLATEQTPPLVSAYASVCLLSPHPDTHGCLGDGLGSFPVVRVF